jgi:hypothetical protein
MLDACDWPSLLSNDDIAVYKIGNVNIRANNT